MRQGDPLRPMVNSLATLHIATQLRSSLKLMYLDDTTLCGSPEEVSADFWTVVPASAELGLKLNFEKCEVIARGGTHLERRETGL